MSALQFKKGPVELGEGVWAYLQPDGSWGLSNAGLVVDRGKSLLIDTLYDVKLTAEMLAAFQSVVPEAASIDYLVNTHENGDHWFGNEAVRAGEIIATKACAEGMRGLTPEFMAEIMKNTSTMGDLGRFFYHCFGKFSYDGITSAFPTRTFEGRLDLEIGGKKVELIEVGPCHTKGDLIVHIPHAGTVFVADVMLVGGHQIMWAGPAGNFIKAIDMIIGLHPRYIVPGHGPITDAQGAMEIRAYWEYYAHEARKRFEKGMEPLDAAKDIPPGRYAGYLEPEKTVITINALYKEFKNDPESVNPVDMFTQMAQF